MSDDETAKKVITIFIIVAIIIGILVSITLSRQITSKIIGKTFKGDTYLFAMENGDVVSVDYATFIRYEIGNEYTYRVCNLR